MRFSKRRVSKSREKSREGFRVLDTVRVFSHRKTSRWGSKRFSLAERQTTVPKAERLSKAIGIRKGSRVLFFAGCYGDWPLALSKENIVTYADASPEMAKLQREKGRGKNFEGIRILEASQWPRTPKKYDWSISYEPVPLHKPVLALAGLRSLLNNRGAKIIFVGNYFLETQDRTRTVFDAIKSVYGCEWSRSRPTIEDIHGKKQNLTVYTLLTNENARKKAWVDIQVMKALRAGKAKETSRNRSVGALLKTERVKRLGLGYKQLVESLQRLQKLAEAVEPKNSESIYIA